MPHEPRVARQPGRYYRCRVSESAQLIDDVIRTYVVPVMKDAGFRKFGRSWYADDGQAVRMLNVQGSSWNSPESACFTVNLGIWFEEAAKLAGAPSIKNRRPPEYQCTVRERIGFLLDPPGDMWWTIAGPTDVPVAGESVSSAIAGASLPWLDEVADPRSAIARLRVGGHSPVDSIAIALALGDRDLASQLYTEWAAKRAPGLGEQVDEWAAAHDLVP